MEPCTTGDGGPNRASGSDIQDRINPGGGRRIPIDNGSKRGVTSFLITAGAHREQHHRKYRNNKSRQTEVFLMKKYIKPSAKSVKQSSVLKTNT
jgi:hypothetical protein